MSGVAQPSSVVFQNVDDDGDDVREPDYNAWLPEPYRDKIPAEQERHLSIIKHGLATAIAKHDWVYGGSHWCTMLGNYLGLKYNMNDEDWTFFVKAIYDMVTVQGLDFDLQAKWAQQLITLIKRRKFHSHKSAYGKTYIPSFASSSSSSSSNNNNNNSSVGNIPELILPWKPLHDILIKTYFDVYREGIYAHKETHGTALVKLAKACTRYWAETATQEMLTEFRPYMCIHDSLAYRGAVLWSTFMPTKRGHPVGTWFGEVEAMRLWMENNREWDAVWLALITRVAKDNAKPPSSSSSSSSFNNDMMDVSSSTTSSSPATSTLSSSTHNIDWDVYIPSIFNTILRMFSLPAANATPLEKPPGRKMPGTYAMFLEDDNVCLQHAAQFCVHLLHFSPVATHLSNLLRYTERFYHPSNGGNWSTGLAKFLLEFVNLFTKRIYKEGKPSCKKDAKVRVSTETSETILTILQPIIYMGMYAKGAALGQAAASSLTMLAYVYPSRILPQFIEQQVAMGLTTMTETHQTRSVIDALGKLARPLVWRSRYSEGAIHITSLLFETLPGIDTNDPAKTITTLKFYHELFLHVPIIDATQYRLPPSQSGEDDVDDQVRSSTSMFGDWVMQFLDRLFSIFANQLEIETGGKIELMIATVVKSITDVLFQQMDAPIHEEATRKLLTFVSNNVIPQALTSMRSLLNSASVARPSESLAIFIPFLYRKLITLPDNNKKSSSSFSTTPSSSSSSSSTTGVTLTHATESETLWYLTLLSDVLRGANAAVLKYKTEIINVLQCTLYHKENVKIVKTAGQLLENVLKTLVLTRPLDLRSVPSSFYASDDFKATHYKTWGDQVNFKSLDVKWHIPNADELAFASQLIDTFGQRALSDLERIISNTTSSSNNGGDHMDVDTTSSTSSSTPSVKHQLYICFRTLRHVLWSGCTLPYAEGEDGGVSQAKAEEAEQEAARKAHWHHQDDDHFEEFPFLEVEYKVANFKSSITQQRLGRLLHLTYQYLLASHEDDTASLMRFTRVLDAFIVRSAGIDRERYSLLEKVLQLRKGMATAPRMLGSHTMWPRRIMIERLQILHYKRMLLGSNLLPYTPTYHALLDDLLALSLSGYSEVRKKAQGTLFRSLKKFKGAVNEYLPKVISILGDSSSPSHAVTGAVYLLSGASFLRRYTSRWNHLSSFLKNICMSYVHLKPTVQTRLQTLYQTFALGYYTLPLDFEAPSMNFLEKRPYLQLAHVILPNQAEMEQALISTAKQNQWRANKLAQTFAALLEIQNSNPNLHWRYQVFLASSFLLLVRPGGHPAPVGVQQFFLSGIASVMPQLRQIAVKGMTNILTMRKIPVQRYFLPSSAYEGTRLPPSFFGNPMVPQFSAETYSSTLFVDKNHFGWNCPPAHPFAVLGGGSMTSSSSQKQSRDDQASSSRRSGVDLESHNKMFQTIMSEGYLKQVISQIHNDKRSQTSGGSFSASLAHMWKYFFSEYQSSIAPPLQVLVTELLSSTVIASSEEKAYHSVASEIIAGMVRGSRHWDFAQLRNMWAWVTPTLQNALNVCSVDTAADWALAIHYIVADFDPRRYTPLLDLLLASPLDISATSAQQAKRIRIAQPMLLELSWRGARSISLRTIELLQPYFAHPYKVVRDKISSQIGHCFRSMYEPPRNAKQLPDVSPGHAVHHVYEPVLVQIISYLDSVLTSPPFVTPAAVVTTPANDTNVGVVSGGAAAVVGSSPMMISTPSSSSTLSHFQHTMTNMLATQFKTGSAETVLPYCGPLLPRLIALADHPDPDMARDAKTTLGCLVNSTIAASSVPGLVNLFIDVLQSESWHTRLTSMPFLQAFLSRNIFQMTLQEEQALIARLVILLSDPQVEVRQLAGTSLASMLTFIDEADTIQLRTQFTKMANTPLPKTNKDSPPALQEQYRVSLLQRHGGVLGLCSVLLSCPYDVPSYLPGLIERLAPHVHDPIPIRTSVKAAFLDFWRTHQDQWETVHKDKFTQQQLDLMNEMLVSPSYFDEWHCMHR